MAKKVQFSKVHVMFANFIVLFVYTTNFFLAVRDYKPLTDLALGIVTIYGAFATGGYFTLCAVRDCSANKHRVELGEKDA